jgi:lipopolysaccharide export system permease protein
MLFDTTLRKELSRTFGAALVVLLTIVLTVMLIRMLGLAADGMVDPRDVALLLGYTALGQLPMILALSMFIAVVISLGRMYRDSEMAIWFASGVGLSRFVRPVLRTAWPVLLVVGVLGLLIWPWANQKIGEMRTRYEQRSDLSRVAPGSFQSSRDGSRVFFIEREGESAGIGRNVFVLSRSEQHESVTTAQAGRIENGRQGRELVLDGGHRNEIDKQAGTETHTRFGSFRMQVDAARADAAQAPVPKTMGLPELLRRGQPEHLGEATWRLGLLFAAANLTLLGIGASATNPRRASNWNLLLALLSFVVYYNLLNLSQAWVASGRLGLLPALLVLHGSAFGFAFALIWWRDHASVLSWRGRRRATT